MYIKMKTLIFIFFPVILLSFGGCASNGTVPEAANKKEMLITEEIRYLPPVWCGSGSVLVYSYEYTGITIHDMGSGEKVEIREPGSIPVACSNDGEWLVYFTKGSSRYEDKENWSREVVDLWRYRIKDGTRQKFATASLNNLLVIRDGIFSPSGSRLFLGRRPVEGVSMPELEWEIVWTRNEWNHSSVVWLSDSSGVVSSSWDPGLGRDVLEVEALAPVKEAVTLDPQLDDFLLRTTDDRGGVYMKVRERGAVTARRIVRCAIAFEEGGVSCETVVERKGHIVDFDVSSDGETIVFSEDGGGCVMAARRGTGGSGCITASAYRYIHNINISPDDKRAVFMAVSDKEEYINGLFVVEVSDD